MADILGIFEHIQKGGEKGKQSRLARMLGEAYNAPMGQRQDALGRIAQVDGQAAIDAEKSFMGADAEAYKQLSERAQAVVSMWPHNPQMAQQAYASMLPLAQRAGISNAPPQLDASLIPGLTKLAGVKTEAEQFTLTPGAARYDASGNLIASQPTAPKYHSPQLVQDDEGNYHWVTPPSGGGMPAGAGAMPAPTTGGGGGMLRSSFDDVIGPLLGREGGYVADDAGAGPTNYGINSRANPDINVASLTPDAARDIYRERYWDAIDADNLPPQIREAAFDAAVNMGVGKARELLQQSGGDPARFDQLRRQHYAGLARANPQKYGQYASGWEKRVAETGGRAVPAGIRGPAKAGNQNEIEKRRAEIAALRQSGVEMSPAEERAYLLSGKPLDDGKPAKPLPVTALKLIKEENDAIQAADEMNFILNRARERIQSGELDLSFLGNLQARGVNLLGNPGNNKSARNFQSFMSDLQKARNASLRLNKGVQTEGDAQRAWDELFKNVTDEQFVLQRMAEIEEINERAMTFRQGNIDMVRQNYGIGPAEDDPAEDVESLLDLYR